MYAGNAPQLAGFDLPRPADIIIVRSFAPVHGPITVMFSEVYRAGLTLWKSVALV